MATGRDKDKKKETSKSGCPFGRKYSEILRALYHLNAEQRVALLRKADKKLVRYICECCLNLLSGNIDLSKHQKSDLRKHVQLLRRLADPSRNLVAKKKIIVQKGGGFLTALLAPLISTILTSLVTK